MEKPTPRRTGRLLLAVVGQVSLFRPAPQRNAASSRQDSCQIPNWLIMFSVAVLKARLAPATCKKTRRAGELAVITGQPGFVPDIPPW
jgi:hypothetical protein